MVMQIKPVIVVPDLRLCWYFLCSCFLKMVKVLLLTRLLHELMCVTHASKTAVTPRVQNPPALMSGRASRLVLVDLDWNLQRRK